MLSYRLAEHHASGGHRRDQRVIFHIGSKYQSQSKQDKLPQPLLSEPEEQHPGRKHHRSHRQDLPVNHIRIDEKRDAACREQQKIHPYRVLLIQKARDLIPAVHEHQNPQRIQHAEGQQVLIAENPVHQL